MLIAKQNAVGKRPWLARLNAVQTESEMHAVFYNVYKCIERFLNFICATIY